MADGRRVAFQRDQQFFVFDPATGLIEQVTDTRFEKDPDDEGGFDVLEAHQKRLYEQLRKAESDAEEARVRAKTLHELDANLPPAPVHPTPSGAVCQGAACGRSNSGRHPSDG